MNCFFVFMLWNPQGNICSACELYTILHTSIIAEVYYTSTTCKSWFI